MNHMRRILPGPCVLALGAAAACSEPAPVGDPKSAAAASAASAQPKAAVVAEAPGAYPAVLLDIPPSTSPQAQAIDVETFVDQPTDPAAARRLLIRTQVLLDRAHFSPGVIDGVSGENVRQAIAAFQQSEGLAVTGQLDSATFAALVQADGRPSMQDYVITEADLAGPFTPKIPADYAEMAKLPALSYSGPLEMLAERFHMDEALLKALNPAADFTAAGATIVVAAVDDGRLPRVIRIEVDKAEREVRAYGEGDALLAVYPATVGSTERPAPAGTWEVRTIAPNPTWSYDPSRLSFGDARKGKMTIAAGPNNPVGSMWIDLTKDTYGIHGGPNPRLIGKTDSHGCVRLTNWDAQELGASVRKGAKVVFVGAEDKAG